MAMFTLFGARFCHMGRPRWAKWTPGKSAKSNLEIEANNRSLYVIIVGLRMKETKGYHLGERIYISRTFLLECDSLVSFAFLLVKAH